MSKRIRVKPGKTQSTMGFVMGLVFCGIGIFVVIPAVGAFGIFWTLGAAAITVINGLNAFGKKGVVSHEIEVEEDADAPEDSATRLETLRQLYDRSLITEEEYQQKKQEILKEL